MTDRRSHWYPQRRCRRPGIARQMARAWCPNGRHFFRGKAADPVDNQRPHHCRRKEAGSFQMAALAGGDTMAGSFVGAAIVGNCHRLERRAEWTQAVAGSAGRRGAEPAYGWANLGSMNTSRWLALVGARISANAGDRSPIHAIRGGRMWSGFSIGSEAHCPLADQMPCTCGIAAEWTRFLTALDADRDLFGAELMLSQIRLSELLSVVQ